MERASSRGMSCLCRGDADEDVHATEMSGESQGQFGKPQSSQGLRGTAGRGKPSCPQTGTLGGHGVGASASPAAICMCQENGARLCSGAQRQDEEQ